MPTDQPEARPTNSSENPTFFALRTTAAALIALAAARALGVHHPWWAAMTVWLVVQPTRGLLIERSVARLAGTVCGALAGAAMLLRLANQPLLSLSVLASWLALCAGLGSIFRDFRNYGFVLAGCTAAIVLLFGSGNGAYDPELALDRVLCTIIGIACSMLASSIGVARGGGGELKARLEDVLRRCLDRVEECLRDGRAQGSADPLLAEIGALERAVEEDAAGSLSRRRYALRVRRISGLLLELIALTSRWGDATRNASVERERLPEKRIVELIALAGGGNRPCLANVLDELFEALRRHDAVMFGAPRDFDTFSVLRAASRPVMAVAIAGAIWWSTAWQTGNMMVMTAALFATLFSSHDQGNQMLIQVLIGSALGALAGAVARLFVLPHAQGLLPTLLCIAPFLLLGAWLIRRPTTAKMAIDLNMTFLLAAQPTSLPAGADTVLNQVVAILGGVLAAVAIYWLVLPATPQSRVRLLAQRIARLTLRMGRSRSAATAASVQRSMRAAQVRLLEFLDPASALFIAAQNCLAEGRRALMRWNQPAGGDDSFRSISTTTESALRRASTALNACIELAPKREPK